MNIVNAQLNYWDDSLDFNREVSCFATPEHGVISVTSDNCSGAVAFGWDEIWGFLRSQESRPKKIIMIHTHPFGCINMSSTDANMVQGWRMGFGVPVEFWVISQTAESIGIAHKYLCDRNNEKKMFIMDMSVELVRSVYPALQITSQILYGMSKSEKLDADDMVSIENQLKESRMTFE